MEVKHFNIHDSGDNLPIVVRKFTEYSSMSDNIYAYSLDLDRGLMLAMISFKFFDGAYCRANGKFNPLKSPSQSLLAVQRYIESNWDYLEDDIIIDVAHILQYSQI